jgi:hypothetical protein
MTTQQFNVSCYLCQYSGPITNHSKKCRGKLYRDDSQSAKVDSRFASSDEIIKLFGTFKLQPARVERQPARVERQPARVERQPARVERQPERVEYKTPQKQQAPVQVPNAPRKKKSVRFNLDEDSQGSIYEAWRYLPKNRDDYYI